LQGTKFFEVPNAAGGGTATAKKILRMTMETKASPKRHERGGSFPRLANVHGRLALASSLRKGIGILRSAQDLRK
jgi:hypothetical protein